MIHLRDVGVVLALHIVGEIGIQGLELGVRFDRVVRFVRPHREEERLRGVAFFLQPRDRLADDERRGVALQRADRLAVADEIARVLVRRAGVVLRGHPPVVAVIAGLRLREIVEQAVEMPLAAMAGRVARALEQSRQGDFTRAQVRDTALGEPRVDAVAKRRAAREQGRARRTAHGAGGVALREPHALVRERVEVRCLDDGMAVAGEVAIAEVVGEEEDEVRLRRERKTGNEERREKGKREEEGVFHTGWAVGLRI